MHLINHLNFANIKGLNYASLLSASIDLTSAVEFATSSDKFLSQPGQGHFVSVVFFSLSLQIARELDQFLEQYGRNVTIQMKPSVDWLADPRRTNNTWEPWIPSGDMFYPYNAAVQLAGLAYYLHIGIVLVAVMCKAFV